MPSTSVSPPLAARQRKLAAALRKHDLDAIALNPGPSLTYLTGLHFHLSERPVVIMEDEKGRRAALGRPPENVLALFE